eukprot:3001537-Prymnesium_polylepis.1
MSPGRGRSCDHSLAQGFGPGRVEHGTQEHRRGWNTEHGNDGSAVCATLCATASPSRWAASIWTGRSTGCRASSAGYKSRPMAVTMAAGPPYDTGWRTKNDGQWQWLLNGDSTTLAWGDQVSLDQSDPEGAVFVCPPEGQASRAAASPAPRDGDYGHAGR